VARMMGLFRMACLAALLCCSGVAMAQARADAAGDYPNRLIKIVIPFPPGGPTDVMSRAIAQELRDAWRQPVIVDNRPGGNSFIATEAVAKAPPDGYTLLVAFFGTLAVNPSLYDKLPYDPVKDFTPITTIATLPLMLVVNPDSPIRTVKDVIDQAKANPGKLTYASGGAGQGAHLAGALFDLMAGTSMVHVPYKGNAPAVLDVMGGHVDMIFDGMTTSLPQVQAGKLRAVAVSTLKRAASMPDLPTVAESGLAGFDVGSWFGALAPAGTPAPIVAKLNAELVRILKSPEILKLMAASGLDPLPSTPAEFAAYMAAETEKWTKVVKEARIKAD
jgi:tripartite-type tricarboxylate transporter receptor subunit TctC